MFRYALGIAGRAEVGKTTLAREIEKHLRNKRGVPATILPFAGSLKVQVFMSLRLKNGRPYKLAKKLGLGVRYQDVFSKPTAPEVRKLLQHYGAEKMFGDPAYWVKEWLYRTTLFVPRDAIVIADDVRFLQECEILRRVGSSIFLIRDGFEKPGNHVSETLSPDFCDEVVFLPPYLSPEYEALVENICDKILSEKGW